MTNNNPRLNKITAHDKHQVVVQALASSVFYALTAHLNSHSKSVSFSAHMYDSASLREAAYVETHTLPTDAHRHIRCCASGRSLDELLHNLDLAHKPSELAEIRAQLSTRALTCCGELVGDRVNAQLSADELERRTKCFVGMSAGQVNEDALAIFDQAQQALDKAKQEVLTAGRFGLRMPLKPDFSALLK